jgi:hypothetical protein
VLTFLIQSKLAILKYGQEFVTQSKLLLSKLSNCCCCWKYSPFYDANLLSVFCEAIGLFYADVLGLRLEIPFLSPKKPERLVIFRWLCGGEVKDRILNRLRSD